MYDNQVGEIMTYVNKILVEHTFATIFVFDISWLLSTILICVL